MADVTQWIDPEARFLGQWDEAGSGLYQNWHRTYDASLGRYLEADPLGLAAGQSLYGYVGQDPVNAIDPRGLETNEERGARIKKETSRNISEAFFAATDLTRTDYLKEHADSSMSGTPNKPSVWKFVGGICIPDEGTALDLGLSVSQYRAWLKVIEPKKMSTPRPTSGLVDQSYNDPRQR